MSRSDMDTPNMALFCDFENVALGVREARYDHFDINRILERLLLKGSIVVKKAYCDWDRYKDFKGAMHQASFELIEIPHVRMSGKNSADIRMVVDALDLCYTKSHVDCFVIISGDSDFSPLVSKLRENNKTVIGVGVKNSTSDLLIKNCDEFIFYDDLVREPRRRAVAKARPATTRRRGERADKADRGDGGAAATAAAEDTGRAAAESNDDVTAEAAAAAPAVVETGGTETGAAAQAPVRAGRRAATQTAAPRRTAGAARRDAPPRTAPTSRRRPPRAATCRPRTRPAGRPPTATATTCPAIWAPRTGAAETGGSPRILEDEVEAARTAEGDGTVPDDRLQRGLDMIVETLEALVAERGEDEKIWGSMVKQTLKRRNPGFNELYYGFKSFNRMLEEARDRHLIALEDDGKSGGYIVRAI